MSVSLLALALHCVLSFYLPQKITNSIGVEAYGFVSLAKQFTSYALIVMTALNSFAARYMSVSYLQGDADGYKKYYNSVLFGDIAIGGILFVLGLIFVLFMEKMFDVPEAIIYDVKIMFVLTFLAFYISTVSTVYLATGYVKDRLDLVNAFRGISYLLELAIIFIFFIIFSPRVWYVGLSLLCAALFILLSTYVMTKRMIPYSVATLKLFNFNALKNLVFKGLWNSVNSMGNALNTGLDLLISNVLLSALAMGQISIAKTINAVIYMIYSSIAHPFHPLFLKRYSANDKDGLIVELKRSMLVCGMFSNVIFAGFCVLGKEFYHLWIPEQDINTLYALTILAMLPCITEGPVYPLYYIYTLTLKNIYPCFVTIIGGLINIVSMYCLIKFLKCGVFSILITTAVIMNFINLVTNPLYMCKCLGVSKKTFYPNLLISFACFTASLLVMKTIVFFFQKEISWVHFISLGLICSLFGFSIQIAIVLITDQYSRQGIKHFSKAILKRLS